MWLNKFDFQLRDFLTNNNRLDTSKDEVCRRATETEKERKKKIVESCEFIAGEFIMLSINFGKCVTGNDLESDLFIFFQRISRYRLVIMGSARA